MAQVKLQDLSFTYPGAQMATLDGLCLEIADGEGHALLGASGSGKTTLLNLLSGILSPSQGSICFDGVDVSKVSGRMRRVAQVFQFPVLYESLYVRDNLAFPLKNQKASAAQIKLRIDYVVDELGLGDILDVKPTALSLFQKQLVAVAKALVQPDIALVLLDEPLTAVEPKIKWRLRQALRKVQADMGVTMVYVTHDQTEALTFADSVSVLTDQGILQTGTPEEIYTTPAHEFVGHFVGSPGMNILPAQWFGVADAHNVGFRPEWAGLNTTQGIDVTVSSIKAEGSQGPRVYGVTTLHTQDNTQVSIRGVINYDPGSQVKLTLTRYVIFKDQVQVGVS